GQRLPGGARAGGDGRSLRGARYRRRDPCGSTAAAVLLLHAGRYLDDAEVRGHRPWPCEQQSAGRPEGGGDRAGERARGAAGGPGRGSTFRFTVRLAKGEVAPPAPRRDGVLRGLRALVVDDNATNRMVLTHNLAGWGMRVAEASGGAEALAALRSAEEAFALALLDFQMPGMDGLELARHIKADPALAGVKLIMLTSLGVRGQREQARAAGIEGYLVKPVRLSQLYDCLATVMAATEPLPSAPPRPAADSERRPPVAHGPRVLLAED